MLHVDRSFSRQVEPKALSLLRKQLFMGSTAAHVFDDSGMCSALILDRRVHRH